MHWGCYYATALDIEVDPQRRRFGCRESNFALQRLVDKLPLWRGAGGGGVLAGTRRQSATRAPFSTDTASHTHTARSLGSPLHTLSSGLARGWPNCSRPKQPESALQSSKTTWCSKRRLRWTTPLRSSSISNSSSTIRKRPARPQDCAHVALVRVARRVCSWVGVFLLRSCRRAARHPQTNRTTPPHLLHSNAETARARTWMTTTSLAPLRPPWAVSWAGGALCS